MVYSSWKILSRFTMTIYYFFNLYLTHFLTLFSTLVEIDDISNHGSMDLPEIYVSARWTGWKCFTTNIPFMKNSRILFMDFKIDMSIFQHRARPIQQEQFEIAIHYPYQFVRSHLFSLVDWESNLNTRECLFLKFRIFVKH